jgi:hypothetical protein
LYPVDHLLQQLERRRVAPLHVFVHRQHRLARRQASEVVDQGLERTLLLLLWTEFDRRVAVSGGNRQQGSDQWRDLSHIPHGEAQQRLDLLELALGRVVASVAGRAF